MFPRIGSIFYILALVVIIFPLRVSAECRSSLPPESPLPEDLTSVGLEQLLSFDLEVTSPLKKAQRYGEVASAIYVITNYDLRRMGVTHIADALRSVPGLQVARIDNHRWAITSRGFNSEFANKLLVLVDGQEIFTPIFNGVFWDEQELFLEDIDRIEVIRGPGAAVWGSNAVNGVINIITCSAQDTQGGLVSAGGGSSPAFFGGQSYGGKLGADTYYRVYGRYSNYSDSNLKGGADANDNYDIARGGIRIDSKTSDKDKLTVKAETFFEDRNLSTTVPSLSPPFVDTESFSGSKEHYGVNLLNRWEHEFYQDSALSFQLDYSFVKQTGLVFPLESHVLHTDIRHHYLLTKSHDLNYGLEYRLHSDDIVGTFADNFDPSSRTTNLFNLFAQDEITLIDKFLRFIVGTKIEHNTFTGLELMPNARFLLTPNQENSIWLSVSRAVANPSRVQDDVIFPLAAFPVPGSPLTGVATFFGDSGAEAEKLTAYELGYRTESIKNIYLDLSLFFQDYTDLVSIEPGIPFVGTLKNQPDPLLIIPQIVKNKLGAQSHGAEVSLEWHPKPWWLLAASYSFIKINLQQGNSLDTRNVEYFEGVTPRNQFNIRSYFDLQNNLGLDSILRYVEGLSSGDINSYYELDLQTSWKAMKKLEVYVVGRNLLHDTHQEFQSVVLPPPATEISRSVSAGLRWSF